MNEIVQIIIVTAAIASAIIYASRRIYKALTDNKGVCDGCPLKDACQKDKRQRNNCNQSK